MTEALRNAVEKKQRSALIIWGALTAGMAIYAAVAGVVVIPMLASDNPVAQHELKDLVFVIVGLAFVLAGAAILVYRAANSEAGMLRVMARKPGVSDPNFSSEEQQLLAVAQQIATNSIIATVLCDVIATLGLVVALLTYRADYLYVSSGIGVLVSLLIMPRIVEAIELAETLQRGRNC